MECSKTVVIFIQARIDATFSTANTGIACYTVDTCTEEILQHNMANATICSYILGE